MCVHVVFRKWHRMCPCLFPSLDRFLSRQKDCKHFNLRAHIHFHFALGVDNISRLDWIIYKKKKNFSFLSLRAMSIFGKMVCCVKMRLFAILNDVFFIEFSVWRTKRTHEVNWFDVSRTMFEDGQQDNMREIEIFCLSNISIFVDDEFSIVEIVWRQNSTNSVELNYLITAKPGE